MAEALKSAGNEAFKRGELAEALRIWRKALESLRPDEQSLAAALHNNCALVLLRQCNWKEAIASASVSLASEPTNEKALFRRSQARWALQDLDGAAIDAQTAHRAAPADLSIAAMANALSQTKRRQAAKFNARSSLPRRRESSVSRTGDYSPFTNDVGTMHALAADANLPAIQLGDQEEIVVYIGNASDARNFFATMAALSTAFDLPNRDRTKRVRIFVNDPNPTIIVRLAILFAALDKVAQCPDIEAAAKDPRAASRETATVMHQLVKLYASCALHEEQHRTVTSLLQTFVDQPRKMLPKWVSLASHKKTTKAATEMLTTKRTWHSEVNRIRANFERVHRTYRIGEDDVDDDQDDDDDVDDMVPFDAFWSKVSAHPDSVLNEQFAHIEAKTPRERRETITRLQEFSQQVRGQSSVRLVEILPGLLPDVALWLKDICMPAPMAVRAQGSNAAPLFLNPTLVDEAYLSYGQRYPVPYFELLWSLVNFLLDSDTNGHQDDRILLQLESCADVMSMLLYRAALGINRFTRSGDRGPELQVELRLGDCILDLEELYLSGVLFDRILIRTHVDRAGFHNALLSSARALRPSKKSCLFTRYTFPRFFAPDEGRLETIDHLLYEHCRLRMTELRSMLHLTPNSIVELTPFLCFRAIDPKDRPAAASPEQVYEWLAGLFLAIAQPLPCARPHGLQHYPSTLATWISSAEFARIRHGDAGVFRLLLDLLHDRLRTRHRYPQTTPEPAPTKKRPPVGTPSVRAYLAELRALVTLWLLPVLGNAISDSDLAAAGIPRSGASLKVECSFIRPADWRDNSTSGSAFDCSLGVVIFTGPSAALIHTNWPKDLPEENINVFSVLEWDSSRHRVSFWLTADDLQRLQSTQAKVFVFRNGRTRTFVTKQGSDISLVRPEAGDEQEDRAAAPPAAAAPAAAAAAAASSGGQKQSKRKNKTFNQDNVSKELPVSVNPPAPSVSIPPPVFAPPPSSTPLSLSSTQPNTPAFSFPAPPAASAAAAAVAPAAAAPPSYVFGAKTPSSAFAAAPVTRMFPATADQAPPVTSEEIFAAFEPVTVQTHITREELNMYRKQVMDLQEQLSHVQLEAERSIAAANARATAAENEAARLREDLAFFGGQEARANRGGGGGGGGGGGRGRGRGRRN